MLTGNAGGRRQNGTNFRLETQLLTTFTFSNPLACKDFYHVRYERGSGRIAPSNTAFEPIFPNLMLSPNTA
jgi:hypothetical protein